MHFKFACHFITLNVKSRKKRKKNGGEVQICLLNNWTDRICDATTNLDFIQKTN